MFYSIIIPTFSRPDEVAELLTSLETQQKKNFEVIITDGSLDDSVKQVIDRYRKKLELKYLYKKGLGISESRNWGVENANGDYVIFFDSDCIIPPQYLKIVDEFLVSDPLDAYGGPDRASENFTNKQKAISYAMTSFYTTGGIRGRKNHLGQYQPRSFNMGIRRTVFITLGGFSGLKVSEDIDLSMRLYKNRCRVGLIEEAYVYHKRRSTFYKFFRQVFSFGSGRIDLQLKHGDALKPVHLLPALFVIYIICGIVAGCISTIAFTLWFGSILVYCLAVLINSTFKNRNLIVGLMSIYAAFVMLTGYGLGMIKSAVFRYLLKNKNETVKPAITREA
jgi:cellulose synthase/poly-beta-1,6-N-acetylglucosamine synthase-like glycosyltransferase